MSERNGNFPSDDDLLDSLDNYEPEQPSVSSSGHYNLSQYEAEKIVGIRDKAGRLPIKNLRPRHKKVLALHVIGKSIPEIADATDYSYGRIVQIINSESSQEFLADLKAAYDSELKSLLPLTIMAVREALLSDSVSTRLAGVDRFIKLSNMGQGNGTESAADSGNTYNTVVINQAREKFVNELKTLAGVENVIDITPNIRENTEDIE